MEFQEILSKFEAVSEQHDGSLVAKCPAHNDSDPSLVIWPRKDAPIGLHCRAGCTFAAIVKAVDLPASAFRNVTGDVPAVSSERPKPVGPMHTAPLAMFVAQCQTEYYTSQAREYAERRFGITHDQATDLMLGEASSQGFKYTGTAFSNFPRLTVPFVSFAGVIHGLQGRDLSGKCPGRWMSLTNPEGHEWGKYAYMPGSAGYDAILVTEGPGDGLTAVGVGYDALAIRGASMVNNPALVAEIAEGLAKLGKQVIVAGDNDKAGRKFTRTLSRALSEHKATVYNLVIPQEGWDLTAWREANPTTFPAALHSAVKSAEPYSETKGLLVDAATGALIPSAETAADALRLINEYSERYGTSEVLCASALVAFTGKTIKYAEGLGFLVWDGSVWVRSDKRARQAAHFMGASLQMAADTIADQDQRKKQLKLAAKFMNTRSLDNIMSELKAIPDVQVRADDFDSAPHLLSFKNGTVNLRTGETQTHSPADMITVLIPVDYDPAAQCPRWEQFLTEIFPNHPEMPAYVQRMVGYGITGETSEQCFAVLHGKGANGKSVLTDTLAKVFGPITKNTPFSTFEERQSGSIPNDIAALKDARLVMSSEGEAGKPMSEALMKRATGGDEMTARFMRQEWFTFTPHFLIMLATNHKPHFKGQDEGLWRRVRMLPFERYFAPEERDYGLASKLLTEASGIIAWAVQGAMDWYSAGLQDPQSVKDATKGYRETSDALSGFLGKPDDPGILIKTGSDADRILGSDAFNMYLDWCEAENLPQKERWRRQTFYTALEERGVGRRKMEKGITLFGVSVVNPDADARQDALDREEAKQAAAGPGIFDPSA